jgi:hypothetical protein
VLQLKGKTGRTARDSVTEVRGPGCIELSHKIISYIYLPVKTNRKYNKTKRIRKGWMIDGSRRAEYQETSRLSPRFKWTQEE